jgi:hypothetical protein
MLSPRVQRALFLRLAERDRPASQRAILDCYFTSYFNAWLDNQNLYAEPKHVITAFTPRLLVRDESVAAFRRVYPDGTLVATIREPKSWYASAIRHQPDAYADLDSACELWRRSTEAALREQAAYPEQTYVVTYERLVTSTEEVMREVSTKLGIDFTPSLLVPTFNGMSIRPNSSVDVLEPGVATTPLQRGAALSQKQATQIDERVGDLYTRVASG